MSVTNSLLSCISTVGCVGALDFSVRWAVLASTLGCYGGNVDCCGTGDFFCTLCGAGTMVVLVQWNVLAQRAVLEQGVVLVQWAVLTHWAVLVQQVVSVEQAVLVQWAVLEHWPVLVQFVLFVQ